MGTKTDLNTVVQKYWMKYKFGQVELLYLIDYTDSSLEDQKRDLPSPCLLTLPKWDGDPGPV